MLDKAEPVAFYEAVGGRVERYRDLSNSRNKKLHILLEKMVQKT